MGKVRPRFWIELGFAVSSGVLAIVTVFWRDWIEVTGWDPDRHSGAAEWAVVAVLAVISIAMALLARVEWRRPLPAT